MSTPLLTNEEADFLLLLTDSELEVWLSKRTPDQQKAILRQLMGHKTETERLIDDPAEFRRKLVIDVDGQDRSLESVIEPWQRKDFEALDPGWKQMVSGQGAGSVMRAWIEKGKGHSKTTDQAVMVSWALFAAQRKIVGVVGAASKDQAKLLRDAIDGLYRRNTWLAERLEIQRYMVVNKTTGSELEIISADEATSHGKLPDFVVVDELTHHVKSGLWESLLAGSAKRANCMLVVITNAGLGKGKSWQWRIREIFRESEGCYFSRTEGPVATWITQERLDFQRKSLPPAAFNRLWGNLWQTGDGDALDPADIEACCKLAGPVRFRAPGLEYVAGLDLGIKHDHAGFVVLSIDWQERKLRLVLCESWKPSGPRGEVDLAAVENAIRRAHDTYNLAGMIYDKHEAVYMVQRLREVGFPLLSFEFSSPKNRDEMARTLMSCTRNQTLELYREPLLLADLAKLSIVEKPYGLKLTAVRDEAGHADRATALAICLPSAMRFMDELAAGIHEQPQGERAVA